MPTGGRLHIELSVIPLGEDEGELPVGLPSASYCRISVADSGKGMAPSVAARIFEPFFTTKGPGKGTGLGLAGAYGFARQAGGTIAVESAEGRGTVFRVYLPVAAELEKPEAGSRKPEGSLKRSSAFLLPSGFGRPASGRSAATPSEA
jgi:two-component system cell cycle sensor histidine kinase/response regulator CckA